MKLFRWTFEGFTEDNFMVVAEDEQQAVALVTKRIEQERQEEKARFPEADAAGMYREWSHDYKLDVFEPNVVIRFNNDY